eukprot:gene9108-6399_t
MSAAEAQNAVNDEEVPALEAAEVPQVSKQSKRYAKAMAKMGLKPEPNITKVGIAKAAALSFSIASPEVYRFPNSNTFVMFGDVVLDNMPTSEQQAARVATAGAPSAATVVEPVKAEEDEEEVDQGSIEDKEISVVMSQANVSRAKAIKALKANNGDLVNAIMELTM